jgi:hypothetical protein
MIRKNKMKLINLILLLCLGCILICDIGECWRNGDPGSPDGTQLSYGAIDMYAINYFNGVSSWFSTHDYIALFALNYLYQHDPDSSAWLCNDFSKFFHIYLVGTEFPDYGAGKAPVVVLDCGRTEVGSVSIPSFGDGPHSIHFTSSEALLYKTAAKFAEVRATTAYTYLLHKDKDGNKDPLCETAAFYLGTMTHYIADVSMPHHTLIYTPLGSLHHALESAVAKVTLLQDYLANGIGSFFRINLLEILGISNLVSTLSAFYCADKMAMITYYNYDSTLLYGSGDGSYNAQWLFDFAQDHPELFAMDWTLTLRNNPLYKSYFDRLEVLLNWAVYYTACALAYTLSGFDGVCGSCGEGEYYKPNPFDRSIGQFTLMFRYAAVFAVVGFSITITTVVAKKIKESLEKTRKIKI